MRAMNNEGFARTVLLTCIHAVVGQNGSYLPSAVERLWLDGNRNGKICATASKPAVVADAELWMQYARRAWDTSGQASPEPSGAEHKALSRIGSNGDVIEPLSGIGRHPFAKVFVEPVNKLAKKLIKGRCCPNSPPKPPLNTVDKFDISYLILFNHCGSTSTKPRVLLFDMGASRGFANVPGGIYDKMPSIADGKAPSLPLFYRMYTNRCLEPDDIFAWEPAMRVSPEAFWGNLPAGIRAKVRFYNVPVNEGDARDARNGKPSPASFLQMLEEIAKPSDFVAVKLDIDTPKVEKLIMELIATKPSLAKLVDEIFFEYHYPYEGCDFGWGTYNFPAGTTVDTALDLFYRLRKLGIRAHFWI